MTDSLPTNGGGNNLLENERNDDHVRATNPRTKHGTLNGTVANILSGEVFSDEDEDEMTNASSYKLLMSSQSSDKSLEFFTRLQQSPDMCHQGTTATTEDVVEAAKEQSSNVTAFVTLLKALFGVSLLSSPRVLGETGLILGTFVYSLLILACVGSCWCLLQARERVAQQQLQEQEQQQQQQQQQQQDVTTSTNTTTPSRPMSSGASKGSMGTGTGTTSTSATATTTSSSNRRRNIRAIITYGDLGNTLLGPKQSTLINFLIVSLHILFGAGLVATSIHQLSIVLGWEAATSDDSNEEYQDNQDDYQEEQLPQVWLKGRMILASIFFPVISVLLQFRNVKDLFWVCSAGLIVFVVGCIGSMIYSTTLQSGNYEEGEEGDGNDNERSAIWDIPEDALRWKWSGIPNFVASTLCAMEGINLALPIANQYLATAPPRTNIIFPTNNKMQSLDRSPVPVVTAAVAVFGVLTLIVAYFGYLSGLGGGSGTQHDKEDDDQDDCPAVAYCLDSDLLEAIHRLSLMVALILTLPIILYPSLELLERWAEERNYQLKTGRTTCNEELTDKSWNGFVWGVPSELMRREIELEEALFGKEPYFPGLHRHWRYRVCHAAAVCLLSIVSRPWERALVLYKGIGLSIACFLLPVVLFVKAYTLPVVLKQPGLAAALAGLMALGFTNFVLVILSVFTKHNFLPTEIHDDPLGHHHESGSRDHL